MSDALRIACRSVRPDAFGVPYQFQIVQNKDTLVLMHEYPGTFRIIPLDGEPHQPDPDPAWLGDSVGRWEGDTLVVDTIGYNDKTEVSGFKHSDTLHTVERLDSHRRRVSVRGEDRGSECFRRPLDGDPDIQTQCPADETDHGVRLRE